MDSGTPNLGESSPSAQERLQMQSLRNVRALVDKLEQEEAAKPRIGVGLMIAGAILLVGVLAFIFVGVAKRGDANERRRLAAVETQALTVDEYLAHVVTRIDTIGNARDMAKVRGDGGSGQGLVGVTLRGAGHAEAAMVKSSGDSRVDTALLSLVRFAGPYGPIPATANGVPVTLTLAMTVDPGKVVVKRVP